MSSPLWEDLKELNTQDLPVYQSFPPRILAHLIWLAEQSPCRTSRHAAAVMATRKIPLSFGYNSNLNGVGARPSGHAEEVALRSILNNVGARNRRRKLSLLVIRVSPGGNLTLSRPCNNCILALKKSEMFHRIFYSNEDGLIVTEKISEMKLYHFSRGHLKCGINA